MHATAALEPLFRINLAIVIRIKEIAKLGVPEELGLLDLIVAIGQPLGSLLSKKIYSMMTNALEGLVEEHPQQHLFRISTWLRLIKKICNTPTANVSAPHLLSLQMGR